MATQTDAILADILAKLDAQDARIDSLSGLATVKTTPVVQTTTPVKTTPVVQTTTPVKLAVQPKRGRPAKTSTVKTDANAVVTSAAKTDTVSGVLSNVAVHGAGAQLEGRDGWFNAVRGITPYIGFTAGQSVTLHRVLAQNAKGADVMRVQSVTLNGAAPLVPTKAKLIKRPTVQTQPVSEAVKANRAIAESVARPVLDTEPATSAQCPFCKNGTTVSHGKNASDIAAIQCATRQYAHLGNAFDITDSVTVLHWAMWLATHEITVWANTKSGRRVIGGQADASLLQDMLGENGAAAAAGVMLPDVAVQEIVPPVQTVKYQTPTDGKFEGILVAHAKKTAGLIRVIGTGLEGGKGDGANVRSNPADLATQKKILGLNVGDRFKFKMQAGYIVSLTVVSTSAAASGVTSGVKTAGQTIATTAKRAESKDDRAEFVTEEQKKAAATEARRCQVKLGGCGRIMLTSSAIFQGKCSVCRSK